MHFLFIVFVAISIEEINTESITDKISSYFNSDLTLTFERKWNKISVAYENAIANSIKEVYGYKTMNIYINDRFTKGDIVKAYYHTDNQVKLILHDLKLEALPYLYDIDVNLTLASNVLILNASVSKMLVHTSYLLFRNRSDVIFMSKDQDTDKSSPFRFEQVNTEGRLAIAIEGCSISGVIVTTLSQQTVNLGNSGLKLHDCQYTIEIYKPGRGLPPVIANYFLYDEEGVNFDKLLSKPLLQELVPILQSAIFSEVNTSAIFTNDLEGIRSKQEDIFGDTRIYIDEIVRDMNKKSLEKDMGTIKLEDFAISWDDTLPDNPLYHYLSLTDVTLMGLDTIYASHAGGPVRLPMIEIHEQLRFSTLQVVGRYFIGIKNTHPDYARLGEHELKSEDKNKEDFAEPNNYTEFALEITDLAVDVTIDSNHEIKFEVLGWRSLEFSCPDLEFLHIESLVVGYLLNKVPKHIKNHIKSAYNGGNGTISFLYHNLFSDYMLKRQKDGLLVYYKSESSREGELDSYDYEFAKLRKNGPRAVELLNAQKIDHNKDHGSIQIQDKDLKYNGMGMKIGKKSHKNANRTKRREKNKTMKKLNKRRQPKSQNMFGRKNKRVKKILASKSRPIHMSDNEIQTN